MIRYVTRHSTYDVDGNALRRVTGENPTVLPVPDGEWLECGGVGLARLFDGREALVAVKDGRIILTTSAIEDTAESGSCAAVYRHATPYDPPEHCGEDTEPGEEFCPRHREEYA